jgi:glycosyltransferase involved in cell wall biosynthesis
MASVQINGRFLTQPFSGVQRFAHEITAALDRGWAATLAAAPTLLLPPAPCELPPYRHLRSHRVGRRGGHIWEQVELPRHARGGILVNLANAAPVLARRQIVVLHDAGIFAHPEAYSPAYRLLHKTLERHLARTRTRFATVSDFSRRELERYLGIPAADIAVISEGADHILRLAPDRSILERHGLAPRRYVLAVGNLAAHKNLAALQALAEMLQRRGLDLAIVGGVPASVFGERNLAIPHPARLLGRASDAALRALYEGALCLAFPSRYEGFGIPPVEAMACGCPVVAATAEAVMEVGGDAALYCHPDDPLEIAAAVGRLIDEPAFADGLRERGRRRVQSFTWDNAAAALGRLIDEIRQENGRNRPTHGAGHRA